MTQPLALVCYRSFVTGGQLVNRLQDLDYRVQACHAVAELPGLAQSLTPLLLVVELTESAAEVCAVLEQLRREPATSHLPVLAFSSLPDEKLVQQARAAGATLVTGDVAVVAHLPQLLEQVLQVE